MFEYAKKELDKKIREIEAKIILTKSEEQNYKNSKNHIISYLDIKNEISLSIKSSVFGGIVGVVFLFIAWEFLSLSSLLCGIACCIFIGKQIYTISNNKKIIDDEYSDVSNFSNNELLRKINALSQKELNTSSEITVLNRQRNLYNIKLDKVKRYKDIIEEVVEEITNDPYYKADTEEEYKRLILAREQGLKMSDVFLNQTIDYSKVHFDSNIGEDIQYTDNSKKLFKKL